MPKHYSINTTEAGEFGWGINLTPVLTDCIFCISRVTEHQNRNIHTSNFFFFIILSSHRWVPYSINRASNIGFAPRSTQCMFRERVEMLSGRAKGDTQEVVFVSMISGSIIH